MENWIKFGVNASIWSRGSAGPTGKATGNATTSCLRRWTQGRSCDEHHGGSDRGIWDRCERDETTRAADEELSSRSGRAQPEQNALPRVLVDAHPKQVAAAGVYRW